LLHYKSSFPYVVFRPPLVPLPLCPPTKQFLLISVEPWPFMNVPIEACVFFGTRPRSSVSFFSAFCHLRRAARFSWKMHHFSHIPPSGFLFSLTEPISLLFFPGYCNHYIRAVDRFFREMPPISCSRVSMLSDPPPGPFLFLVFPFPYAYV